MNRVQCKDCSYSANEVPYKQVDCGIIELLMLRDIHIRTFGHKVEIVKV